MAVDSTQINNHAAFIWSVADLLRGDYKQSEYGRVILPLTVIRRLDCALADTRDEVRRRYAAFKDVLDDLDPILAGAAGLPYWNTSELTFPSLLADSANLADNLRAYIRGFAPSAKDVIERFGFAPQIERLERSKLLYPVIAKFAELDLHPARVSNIEMGYLYEELIRRFSELSNETAGEHFTPREVIRLMVRILFAPDREALAVSGVVRRLLDPACGTGGMLSVAEDELRALNPRARLEVFGQELNAETYAICRSDMMLKGQRDEGIVYGNSFSDDGHATERFDYLLANPPFGVEWKKVADEVRAEFEQKGHGGRFGAGVPRINDGSFLFLQHMIAKMERPQKGGARLAIVFNGSPLFTGAAGSGESEIRRWIIENDRLEAVIALPDQLFYNTGISTYIWVVTNRKAPERTGTVRLIDARELWTKMRKSLGAKRKLLSDEQIAEIVALYEGRANGDRVKVFANEAFGFMRITVERPLRLRWEVSEETLAAVAVDKKLAKLGEDRLADVITALTGRMGATGATESEMAAAIGDALGALELTAAQRKTVIAALAVRDDEAPVITDAKGNPLPDPDLRDQENVPLPAMGVTHEQDASARLASPEYRRAVDEYMTAEVLPYVPDAWVDHSKTRIGYEIPLTRHFYRYVPPRPLEEIDAEIRELETEIQALLAEVSG